MTDSKSRPVTVADFNDFVESLVTHLNKVNNHNCRRLDDIERRLDSIERRLDSIERRMGDFTKSIDTIEGNMTHVKRNTELLPDIFSILHEDGDAIAKLTSRLEKLEN